MLITTYTYDAQNRLMLTVTIEGDFNIKEAIQYTYDNNGNQLTTTRTEYIDGVPQASVIVATNTYDALNQLISTVTSSGDTIVNAYNGDGLRVSKTVNGVITLYLYEASRVVLEQDGQGNQTAWNVYGTNLIMRKVGADTLTYMYNGHADVTALLDSNGNLMATYYYDAFGNILEKTGTAENSILYGGYQYDEETGLYYLNARMYDPVTARFLQQDTNKGYYNDPLSLNLYTYCHNEPLMYSDPTGHREIIGTSVERETEMERKQSLYMMNKGRKAIAPGFKEYEKAQIEAEQKAAAASANSGASKRNTGSNNSSSGSNSAAPTSQNVFVIQPNTTLAEIAKSGIWRHYDPSAEGFYKAQQMFLLWYWGTDTINRIGDGYSVNNAGWLVVAMDGKQGKGADLSKLTVQEMDNWYNEVNRVAFGVTAVAVMTYGVYATYAAEKYTVSTSGAVVKDAGNAFGPTNKGPLPDAVANTFRSGTYSEVVTQGETTLYRVYGGKAGEIGSYWTTTKPQGSLQSVIDGALDQSWGNTATNISTINVPKGTTIYQGYATPQGGLVGGGVQVYIPEVNPSWLVR